MTDREKYRKETVKLLTKDGIMNTGLLTPIETDYDKVGQYNQDTVNGFTKDILNKMTEIVKDSKSMSVLDGMGGNGNLSLRLYHDCQESYGCSPDITMLEFSQVQCEIARKQCENSPIKVIWGDILTMEDYETGQILSDYTFDCVMMKSANHEIPLEKQVALYKSVFRVLKPGGLFVNLGFLFDDTAERDEFRKLTRFKDRTAGLTHAAKNRHILTRDELYTWLRQAGFVDIQCGMHLQYAIHSWIGVQAYFPEPVWERMHAALQAQWARALVLRRQGRIHFHRDSSTLLCPGEITVAHRPFSSPDFSIRW